MSNCENAEVSVICVAYNHEPYIRECLEGFVMQKTNFKFEVIIHDDASTDHTADIIREYEREYPDIIKPIYETENQYSQHIKFFANSMWPRLTGKYIAVCDGDDRWTDPLKLQKQYDFLETHPDYSLCVHCTRQINSNDQSSYVFPLVDSDRDYETEDIIQGGGSLFAWSSVMGKKEFFQFPPCFNAPRFGDYQHYIFYSTNGKVRCLADIMSVYNGKNNGSWTERVWGNEKNRLEYLQSMIDMLKNINEYYEYKYDSVISEKLNREVLSAEYLQHKINRDKKALRDKKFAKHRKSDKKQSRRFFIIKHFPALYNRLKKLRNGKDNTKWEK